MKIVDIKLALTKLIEAYEVGAIIMANEKKDVKGRQYFVELVPSGFIKVDHLIDKSYWVYIRCHDIESTHLSRLETFEFISEVLLNGLSVLDRVLHPSNIGYEEIEHVLEIKFKVEFTDVIEDTSEKVMMQELEMEV